MNVPRRMVALEYHLRQHLTKKSPPEKLNLCIWLIHEYWTWFVHEKYINMSKFAMNNYYINNIAVFMFFFLIFYRPLHLRIQRSQALSQKPMTFLPVAFWSLNWISKCPGCRKTFIKYFREFGFISWKVKYPKYPKMMNICVKWITVYN